MSEPWWKSAVFYQIYPRSFAASGASGVGDLAGITQRLDHLQWLGVNALWLSPFFPSPMRDFGYDVSDYCDVNSTFGTLADFDALVATAHAMGLRVIIDWVAAHTSSDHAWFVNSRSSRQSARRDWYVWRDPAPGGGPPNNWRAAFTHESAWELDPASGQYYLHCFLPSQPDLNWANPEVRCAMHDTLRFWLDRGVDGFRADVVHNIGKDPGFPDVPEERATLPAIFMNDQAITHEYLREIRALLDGYEGERIMVGEVGLPTIEQISRYQGQGDELQLVFNFTALFTRWSADKWRRCIERTRAALEPGAWPNYVLSNHDQARHRTRYGSEARARAAAVLLLSLRGTPFLYMGEELGLEDAVVPDERVVDPGGRDGCRAPLPWDANPGHGWGPDPWLPFPPAAQQRNLATLREQPDSILHLYRRLLRARRDSPALSLGVETLLDAPEDLLVYCRESSSGDRRFVAVNYADEPRALPGYDGYCVQVASDGVGEGQPFPGKLRPDQAVVLRAPGE